MYGSGGAIAAAVGTIYVGKYAVLTLTCHISYDLFLTNAPLLAPLFPPYLALRLSKTTLVPQDLTYTSAPVVRLMWESKWDRIACLMAIKLC